eukprot:5396170-Amphidinium_carterae.1
MDSICAATQCDSNPTLAAGLTAAELGPTGTGAGRLVHSYSEPFHQVSRQRLIQVRSNHGLGLVWENCGKVCGRHLTRFGVFSFGACHLRLGKRLPWRSMPLLVSGESFIPSSGGRVVCAGKVDSMNEAQVSRLEQPFRDQPSALAIARECDLSPRVDLVGGRQRSVHFV